MKNMFLGKTEEGRPVYITPEDRKTHMQIIGSTGEGKSKFMEHMIREDILNGNGLCLIDPHGYLYEDIVKWCWYKRRYLKHRKIILLDPSEDDWAFGFNPLDVRGREIAYHVDAMVKAVAKVWGGEDQDRTPRLKRNLEMIFNALAEKHYSLLETQFLIDPKNEQVRKYLTDGIQNEMIKQQWDYFNMLNPRQFYDEFSSTINRMMAFLTTRIIKNTIGQLEDTINFRKAMDEGWIVLVNLSATDKVSEDNARLLGTLIVNDLFMNAKGRPKNSRPFYFYIDECARFINEDIGRIMDEGRKFGLHLILAHQTLAQLRKAGEAVYHSVKTDAKTKVVFGGLNIDDAEVLANQMFIGEIDLEEPKESLIKPTVVGHAKTLLKSRSHSKSEAWGGAVGSVTSTGESRTQSESISRDNDSGISTTTRGSGSGQSASEAHSESMNWSGSRSESEGVSEAFESVYEDRPTQVYSLEEQIYRNMAIMVNQPMRFASVKLPKQKPETTITPYVDDIRSKPEWIQKYKKEIFQLAEFIRPRLEVEEEVKQRWIDIKETAVGLLAEPKTYRE